MPRIHFHPEIVQCRASLEDTPDKIVCPQAALIFDDSHSLGTAYGMFLPYPERRDLPVELFLLPGEFSSLGLFYGLYYAYPVRPETLVTGILVERARTGERVHGVGNPLVMCFAANTLADKKDETAGRDNDRVLEGMFLFLPTIVILLLLGIHRAGDFAFCPVMDQNGRLPVFQGEPCYRLGKFLPAFSGHGIGMDEGLFEYRIQDVDEIITVFLGHPETGRMVFLERIVLQVNQDKEQTVLHRGQRTAFINGEPPPVIAVIAIHVIMAEILVMGLLEIKKQGSEMFQGKPCQGTETIFLVLIIAIFHDTKVRARTYNTKSILYFI